MNSSIVLILVIALSCVHSNEDKFDEFCKDFYGVFDMAFTYLKTRTNKTPDASHYIRRKDQRIAVEVIQSADEVKLKGMSDTGTPLDRDLSVNPDVYFNVKPNGREDYVFCGLNQNQTEIKSENQTYEVTQHLSKMNISVAFMALDNCVLFMERDTEEYLSLSFDSKTTTNCTKTDNNTIKETMNKLKSDLKNIIGVLHIENQSKSLVFFKDVLMKYCLVGSDFHYKSVICKEDFNPCYDADNFIGIFVVMFAIFYFVVLFVMPLWCLVKSYFKKNRETISEETETDTDSTHH